jgi:glycosyltransferase involved in cell wall biosynthesis
MDKFFTSKNVLIISPEPWDHLFVSKHHYAIELARKNQVYFLNPSGKDWASKKTKYENVFEVSASPFISGLRHLPRYLQKYLIRKKFNKIQKHLRVKFDCIWSFDNSVFFDFSALPADVFTITHVMDYSQNFQLQTAARTAKICMAVSQNILTLLKPFNENSHIIGHGIALDRIKLSDITLPGTGKVKAIFAGNLDRKHFDKEILLTLAKEHPTVDFIFYGPGGQNWERLGNTYYPGVVESERLINYLTKADILLLPYKFRGYEKELTNSHKVLDYLRSGRVIVSSYLEDYGDRAHLLEMAHDLREFQDVFSQVVAKISQYNSEENIKARIDYASQHSYTKRLAEIDELVQQTLHQLT